MIRNAPETSSTAVCSGVGVEWLVYVSFIAPIVLLAALWWIGSRNTV